MIDQTILVRHATGQYVNLPSAPEPSDLLFYAKQNKKKALVVADVLKFFGQEKKGILESSLKHMEFEGTIRKTGEDVYQIT